jgi:glycosyltransferase involved in cell wall biosynthesis
MREAVSLIIPCFNQAAFLPAAIESALAQALPPAEILVVDDGSTDGSAALAARYGGPVRVIRQPNRGAAAARNAGVREARHGLLAFLDGDDLWPPGSLAVRLALLRDSGADYAFGGVRQFRDGDPDADAGPAMAGRVAGALLVRREGFDRVGFFDAQLRSAEVIDWSARAAAFGLAGAATAEIVLLRRIHGANMMLTATGTEAAQLAVLRAHVARKRAASA